MHSLTFTGNHNATTGLSTCTSGTGAVDKIEFPSSIVLPGLMLVYSSLSSLLYKGSMCTTEAVVCNSVSELYITLGNF